MNELDPALLRFVACLCVGAFACGFVVGILLGENTPKPPRITQKPLSWWRRYYGLRRGL